jgi:hypothetical protein
MIIVKSTAIIGNSGEQPRAPWSLIGVLVLLFAVPLLGEAPRPVYTYLNDFAFGDKSAISVSGPARVISLNGRKGINMSSIRSFLELKAHTLNEPQGTVSLWFFPLEDLSAFDSKPLMGKSNPNYYTYPFLSDSPNPQDYNNGDFKIAWTPRVHPSITALFAKGSFYEEAFEIPHRAFVSVSYVAFHRNTWYQLALSWDYTKDKYSLYLNGILIGREDQFYSTKLHRDPIRPSLYAGNPALCLSTIEFYNTVLSPQAIYSTFRAEATSFSQELEDELISTYDGTGKGTFSWSPGKDWQKKLSVDFNKPSDLDGFYVQGNPVAVKVTNDGLLMETIDESYTEHLLDSQVYLWSGKPFEGDLYVEYEFKVLRPGGLSLLMVQASGMNREDFMADYPLRTSGRMLTVYGEDVRNYHWEYYREMSDMRNDVSNSALMKNPFLYPLSFSALTTPVEKNTWHKLQFLQIGNKLTGAIDGVIMVEFTDDGFTNNGPVYNYGRIAIRCMLHSKLLFRNLRVYNRNSLTVEELIP